MKIRSGAGTLILAALMLLSSAAFAKTSRPKLILQITADQLRGDLLDRYRSVFTGGLKRILDGGYWIHRGDVDHGLTLSFPGQTTLATGMYPSHHGLTANEWWMERNGKWQEVDVVIDEQYKTLATPQRDAASPRNLTATTLGEWVKLANRDSKTIALSAGNSIAVAYGGTKADAVYWYDSTSGRFTTSTFYAAAMKPWVSAFNAGELQKYESRDWALSVPSGKIALANPDATDYENKGHHNTFPHIYDAESRADADGGIPTAYSHWFTATPMEDEALLGLAADAVDAERLGQRGVTDYLAVLIDSTDNVGHKYGPLSLEQLDTLVRIDRALGHFLDHLDATVGPGNYVLAFSADHGVVDPNESKTGRRIRTEEIEVVLDRIEALAIAHKGSREQLVEIIITELKKVDFIADAYSEAQLAAPSTDPFIKLYQNTFRKGYTTDFPLWTDKQRAHHPARYGVIARFKENMIIDAATGVHGSPYPPDRLVPIIFFGANIQPGSVETGGRTIDVAPTLAAAGEISAPHGLDGIVLKSAIQP